MATSSLPRAASRGGSFLVEACTPEDVFTPAELTDDQKLIGQTAEEFVPKEVVPVIPDLELHKAGLIAATAEKSRRTRTARRRRARGVRRRGPRQSFLHAALRKNFRLRVLQRERRRALRHRHAAHRLFRHRRAEEKISARSSPPANGLACYCLSEPQAGSDAQNSRTRAVLSPDGKHLDSERPENVDHQRRLRRRLHRLRQSGRREIFLFHRRARLSRIFRRAPKKKRWACTAAPRRRSFSRIARCPRKICCMKSAAATSWPSTF